MTYWYDKLALSESPNHRTSWRPSSPLKPAGELSAQGQWSGAYRCYSPSHHFHVSSCSAPCVRVCNNSLSHVASVRGGSSFEDSADTTGEGRGRKVPYKRAPVMLPKMDREISLSVFFGKKADSSWLNIPYPFLADKNIRKTNRRKANIFW